MGTFNCTGQVSTTLKPEWMSCRDAGPSRGQFPPNACCISPQKIDRSYTSPGYPGIGALGERMGILGEGMGFTVRGGEGSLILKQLASRSYIRNTDSLRVLLSPFPYHPSLLHFLS